MRTINAVFKGCLLLVGVSLAACSNGGTTDVGTQNDTGVQTETGTDVGTGTDTGSPTDTGIGTDSGTGTDGGSGVDCSAPGTLHQPRADAGTANLYCPFSGVDGGSAMYCASGTEHCCEPSAGAAACSPLATACATGDTDWQCEDPGADCPSGQQCCGMGTLNINPIPACANFASGFHGTHCAASCGAGEIRMCTSSAECAAGQTCIPFKSKGNQVGGCM